MERKGIEGKRGLKDKASKGYLVHKEREIDMEEEEVEKEDKKKTVLGRTGSSSNIGGGRSGGGVSPRLCQVERCGFDLTEAKQYHRRHKVCEVHAKAHAAIVAGLRQRFCQQCSRFHELSEFDDAKRSCRRRLAGHNERRRKSSSDNSGEGSGRRGVSSQFIQTHERSRVQMTLPTTNPSFKRAQIR